MRAPTDLPGVGFLVVDNEGSLWVGSSVGLLQIPEPDTVIFSERDGLPNGGVRYLKKNEEGVWSAAWFGGSLIEKKDQDWRVRYEETNPSWLDVDAQGDPLGTQRRWQLLSSRKRQVYQVAAACSRPDKRFVSGSGWHVVDSL